MTRGLVALPALSFRTDNGDLDTEQTARYAERAAATWLDAFILSGTTTEGDTFTVDERAAVVDIWRQVTSADRLLACCWDSADIKHSRARGIRPLAAMRALKNHDEACRFFAELPTDAFVYSHPMHTATVLDAELIAIARDLGCLPAGAKISKMDPGSIPELRRAAGDDFVLLDGSSRRIAESVNEGASGVVSTPLAALPDPFPGHDDKLQRIVNTWQARLDAIPHNSERAAWLRSASLDDGATRS